MFPAHEVSGSTASRFVAYVQACAGTDPTLISMFSVRDYLSHHTFSDETVVRVARSMLLRTLTSDTLAAYPQQYRSYCRSLCCLAHAPPNRSSGALDLDVFVAMCRLGGTLGWTEEWPHKGIFEHEQVMSTVTQHFALHPGSAWAERIRLATGLRWVRAQTATSPVINAVLTSAGSAGPDDWRTTIVVFWRLRTLFKFARHPIFDMPPTVVSRTFYRRTPGVLLYSFPVSGLCATVNHSRTHARAMWFLHLYFNPDGRMSLGLRVPSEILCYIGGFIPYDCTGTGGLRGHGY